MPRALKKNVTHVPRVHKSETKIVINDKKKKENDSKKHLREKIHTQHQGHNYSGLISKAAAMILDPLHYPTVPLPFPSDEPTVNVTFRQNVRAPIVRWGDDFDEETMNWGCFVVLGVAQLSATSPNLVCCLPPTPQISSGNMVFGMTNGDGIYTSDTSNMFSNTYVSGSGMTHPSISCHSRNIDMEPVVLDTLTGLFKSWRQVSASISTLVTTPFTSRQGTVFAFASDASGTGEAFNEGGSNGWVTPSSMSNWFPVNRMMSLATQNPYIVWYPTDNEDMEFKAVIGENDPQYNNGFIGMFIDFGPSAVAPAQTIEFLLQITLETTPQNGVMDLMTTQRNYVSSSTQDNIWNVLSAHTQIHDSTPASQPRSGSKYNLDSPLNKRMVDAVVPSKSMGQKVIKESSTQNRSQTVSTSTAQDVGDIANTIKGVISTVKEVSPYALDALEMLSLI